MNSPKQPAATTATETKTASEFERLLAMDAKGVEFAPFATQETIRLSVPMVQAYIATPSKDGHVPNPRQCTRFIMLCKARRLNPFEGDAFMVPFWDPATNQHEWSLITSHNALLKRGEMHPDYNGKKSGVIFAPAIVCGACNGVGVIEHKLCPMCSGRGELDEIEGDYLPELFRGQKVSLVGGWCRVFYQGKTNPEYQRLKLATYAKTFGVWKFDAPGMICKCAEAAALRSAFPNTLGGMYLREEMGNELLESPQTPRPIFMPEPAKTAQETPEPVSVQPLAPQPQPTPIGAQAEPVPTAKMNHVKAVRNLCRADKIKEGDLLAFLTEIGSVGPGSETLEQLALTAENILPMVADQWADIAKRIVERGKEA